MKISILCFDLSDNAAGRAELLARLLAPRHEVTVVGPTFGRPTWAPLAGSPVRHRALAGHRYPRFLADLPALLEAIDGDVLYASKPRPTSFGLGLVARARLRRPLLLDVDDWELGFFRRAGRWGRVGRLLNLGNPNGMAWTWAVERLIRRADALTVSSRFLQERHGGLLLPHVRDTEAWDPARMDRAAARRALDLGPEPLVMFLGTPRAYKGVEDLVAAVGLLRGRARLALVGAARAGRASSWKDRPFVRALPPIPFDEVPRVLVGADVVVIPQRDTPETVGQVPAKLFDAMALARPIVATSVATIPEILGGCGIVVPPGDPASLASAIAELLDDPARARRLGGAARARCEAHFSFAAARARLFPLVESALGRGGAP